MAASINLATIDSRLAVFEREGCFEEEPCGKPMKVVTVLPNLINENACRSTIFDIADSSAISNLPGTASNQSSIDYTTRLICLTQDHSWACLNVTSNTLRVLMYEHSISGIFLDLVSSCFLRTSNVEEGLCMPFQVHETNEILEYVYIFKYAEKKDSKEEPWVIRQTALYHQIRKRDDRSTFVLINPRPSSSAQDAAIAWLQSMTSVSQCKSQGFSINIILMESHIDGIRHYMRHFERKVEEMSLIMQGRGFEDRDGENARFMTTLNWIESKLLPLYSMIAGFERTRGAFGDMMTEWNHNHASSTLQPTGTQLEYLSNTIQKTAAYHDNLKVLLQKCDRASKVLNGILNFNAQKIAREHQEIALRQSERVEYLTHNTVDDSATVKVITVLTLVFLSFTAVAAIMDMPIFYLDTESKELLASPSTWIYFVVAVPLTAVLFAVWRTLLRMNRRRRETHLAEKQNMYKV